MTLDKLAIKQHSRGGSLIQLVKSGFLDRQQKCDNIGNKINAIHKEIELVLRDRLANDMYCELLPNETAYDYIQRVDEHLRIYLNIVTASEFDYLKDNYGECDDLYGSNLYNDKPYDNNWDAAYDLRFINTPIGVAPFWLSMEYTYAPACYTDYTEGVGDGEPIFSYRPLETVGEFELLLDALNGGDISCYKIRGWMEFL